MVADTLSAPPKRRLWWPLRWVLNAAWFLVRALLVGWVTFALYYQLHRTWYAILLALAALALGIYALWFTRSPRPPLVFAGVFALVLAWWATIHPSHDREWRPEVAVLPRVIVDGDRLTFTGVRNFDYRTADDFTERYEEREVLMSDLEAVDFFVSFWMPGPFGHTFLSFVFGNAPPISVSIETRTEVGEGFDPLASLFKEFDLIYVVGEERDIVGARTNHRDEQVFMYRINSSPEGARRLLEVYIDRINSLADQAEFYNLLSNSCTVNIVRYARSLTPVARFDPRFYLNGLIDRFLYSAGAVDTSVPFPELHARANITETARAAGEPADFYRLIRAASMPNDTISLR